MQTNNRLRHVAAEQLVDGELFIYCFDAVNRSLLMKLFTPPNGGPLYGVLDSASFETPFSWYSGDVTGSRLTYGTDWYLETIPGPETHAGSRYQYEPTHRLFLDRDSSLVWRFKATEGFRPGSLDYAIGDTQHRSMDHTAAPIGSFRIWANQEAYCDIRSRPILSYPAEKSGKHVG